MTNENPKQRLEKTGIKHGKRISQSNEGSQDGWWSDGQDIQDDKWYLFDDSSCSYVDVTEIAQLTLALAEANEGLLEALGDCEDADQTCQECYGEGSTAIAERALKEYHQKIDSLFPTEYEQ